MVARRRIVADRRAILDALGDGATWATAAAAGAVGLRTLLRRWAEDVDFGAQCNEARRAGRQLRAAELERVLFAGASKAGEDPRFQASLFFALCNLDGSEWRHRTQTDHRIDGTVGVNVRLVSDADLAGLLQAVLQHSGNPASAD